MLGKENGNEGTGEKVPDVKVLEFDKYRTVGER